MGPVSANQHYCSLHCFVDLFFWNLVEFGWADFVYFATTTHKRRGPDVLDLLLTKKKRALATPSSLQLLLVLHVSISPLVWTHIDLRG